LTAARLLQGAGTAAGMVVGRALVQDLFHGPDRTRVMAYVGMAMGLCPPAATILGGQVHVLLGWRANFVLMALLSGVLLLAAWRGLPDAAAPPAMRPPWLGAMLGAYARLARDGLLLRVVICRDHGDVLFSGRTDRAARHGVGPAASLCSSSCRRTSSATT
jgi:DHA1 family bicyclomycin/chloramphenicol resistance-like MFS transporter